MLSAEQSHPPHVEPPALPETPIHNERRKLPADLPAPAAKRKYQSQVMLTVASLIVADMLSAVLTVAVASTVFYGVGSLIDPPVLLAAAVLSISLMLANWLCGLYPGTGLHPAVELRAATVATSILFLGLIAGWLTTSRDTVGAEILLIAYISLIAGVPVFRTLMRSACCRARWWGQPLLIIDDQGDTGVAGQYFRIHPELGLRPITRRDDHRPENDDNFDRYFWACMPFPALPSEQHRGQINQWANRFRHLIVVPHIDGIPSVWNSSFHCGTRPGIHITNHLLQRSAQTTKRTLDLLLVLLTSPIWAPIFAVVAVLIKTTSRGPIFYRQKRIGKDCRLFNMWKFRTMEVDSDEILARYLASDPQARNEWETTQKLRNDPRVTRLGRWLRKTSLDELPQLWNVICRQMSLVGPRPWPFGTQEISEHNHYMNIYSRTLPGLTGLWQISGRSDTTCQQRMTLDIHYVQNWSPWLDLYILLRSIKVVIRCEGAY